VIAAFAGLGILIVSLLGGDDLSKPDSGAQAPGAIGPPPEVPRSAAVDALENKTWDEMTADERALVESEARRVFDNSTFRATNKLVLAIDVYRQEGQTLASRQYREIEAAGGTEVAPQILFFCDAGQETEHVYRYILSSVQRDFYEAKPQQYQQSFSPILALTDWSEVRDLGIRNSEPSGRRAHGFELGYAIGQEGTPARRIQYWFDVETAQLLERGEVFPGDDIGTEQNWYRLRYDQYPPIIIPDDLEQPDCVKDVLAKISS
jgi:hypothetical protein